VIGRATKERTVGLLLLLLMVAHTVTHPDRGAWVLLSACDVATLATGIGLVGGWPRAVAVAFLFQISIGLPAFFAGLATHTYTPNTTSVAIHLLPPLAGGWAVRRTGLPPHALATALLVYLLVVAASFLFSPPALNVNLVFTVWPPIRRFASGRLAGLLLFHGVGPLILLSVGEAALRRGFPGTLSSPQAPSRAHLPDTSG
jgi:hypothetical protein